MNDRVNTVFVKGQDGKPLQINEDEYDEKEHGKQIDPNKVDTSPSAATIQPTGTIEGTGGQRVENTEQRVALQPPQQPASAPGAVVTEGYPDTNADGQTVTEAQGQPQPAQYMVGKSGKRHFVVTPQGEPVEDVEGIDPKGYTTDKEAWDAIFAIGKTAE